MPRTMNKVNGKVFNSGNREWTDEDVKFLKENYRTMPTAEIAERLGRTEDAIRSAASIFGATKRVNLKRHLREIREMMREGKSREHIAESLGVSRSSVCDFVRKERL